MIHAMTITDPASGESWNTRDDWGLALMTQPVFNLPPVKSHIIDLPGGNGVIDLTEAVSGYPAYGNRTGAFEFVAKGMQGQWQARISQIARLLHGQYVRIELDDDPGWYQEGRLSLNVGACVPQYGTVVIDYSVGPFKWADRLTTEPWLWDPFNFNTGVIGSATYWDESTDPPTLVYTGYGDAYGHITVTNAATPLVFSYSGSAPVQPVFTASNKDIVLEIYQSGTSIDTKTLTVGTPASIAGLVLCRGKWLYNGRLVTVSGYSVESESTPSTEVQVDPSTAPIVTVTGASLHFTDALAASAEAFTAAVSFSQSGTGDPSPTNIRPITGYSGITIYSSGADTSSPTTLAITWATEAGTVGTGTIDILTGVFTITHKYITLTGGEDESWASTGTNKYYYLDLSSSTSREVKNDRAVCSHFTEAPTISGSNTVTGFRVFFTTSANKNRLLIRPGIEGMTTTPQWKAWLAEQAAANTPLQVVYELETPITIQLTAGTFSTLAGENNIWTDDGILTLSYKQYVEPDPPPTVEAMLTVAFREGRL